jgi:cystinosin
MGYLHFISLLFGWVYTLCWSLSFYPQPILNFRRKSTSGTTIDFPAINVLGFLAYFASNAAFLYSSQIRYEYALRNHGLTPTVQFNDLAFAGHAVILSAITLSQFFPAVWGFDKRGKRGAGVRVSKGIMGLLVGSFVGVGVVAIIVAARNDEDPKMGWAWIDVVCIAFRVSQNHTNACIARRSMQRRMSSSSSRL